MTTKNLAAFFEQQSAPKTQKFDSESSFSSKNENTEKHTNEVIAPKTQEKDSESCFGTKNEGLDFDLDQGKNINIIFRVIYIDASFFYR